MKKAISNLVIGALSVIIVDYFMKGISLDSFTDAFLVAIVIAFLNTIVRPILVFFSLPITLFSLGFFLLVINAFLVLIADYAINGFHVNTFMDGFWFSIFLWLVQMVLNIFNPVNEKK